MADNHWEEPLADATVDQRIKRLERMAESVRELQEEDGRLTAGVKRLGDNTEALTKVLRAVDDQARSIARVDKRTEAVETKAVRAEERAHAERKAFVRRAYLAAALTSAFALIAVIGGAWLTDAHLQRCLIDGPISSDTEQMCDVTFPGHDHRSGESIQDILTERTVQVRAGCERDNQRVRINISQTERLRQLVTDPRVAAALDATLADFRAILVDCEKAYPLAHEAGRR